MVGCQSLLSKKKQNRMPSINIRSSISTQEKEIFLLLLSLKVANLIFKDQSKIIFYSFWNNMTLFSIIFHFNQQKISIKIITNKEKTSLIILAEKCLCPDQQKYYWQMLMLNNDPSDTIINALYSWSHFLLDDFSMFSIKI